MKIDEEFPIEAAAVNVWGVLRDPATVAQCFPGAELTDQTDETTYVGVIRVRFGPTVATFSGRATITIDDVARTAIIEASGKDGRGSSRAKANTSVGLIEDAGISRVRVVGSINVTGPLGSFAEAGGVYVARELMKQFAANVVARAGTQSAPASDRAATGASPPISALRVFWAAVRSALAKAARRIRSARKVSNDRGPR